MKYFAIVIFFVLSSCQDSKPKASKQITQEEKQIAKNLIQGAFDDLWSAADSTKINHYHTTDFIILEQGKVWNNDSIKLYMRKKLARTKRLKRTNRMDYISIEKYEKSMYIAYYNYANFWKSDTIINKASWLESALAIKTSEGWKLKWMHSTRIKDRL